jgi:hypothetical protein
MSIPKVVDSQQKNLLSIPSNKNIQVEDFRNIISFEIGGRGVEIRARSVFTSFLLAAMSWISICNHALDGQQLSPLGVGTLIALSSSEGRRDSSKLGMVATWVAKHFFSYETLPAIGIGVALTTLARSKLMSQVPSAMVNTVSLGIDSIANGFDYVFSTICHFESGQKK